MAALKCCGSSCKYCRRCIPTCRLLFEGLFIRTSGWGAGGLSRERVIKSLLHSRLVYCSFAHPLGIECSAEGTHTILYVVQQKVFNRERFLSGEFGRGNGEHTSLTASNSPWFFCSTFCIKTKSGIKEIWVRKRSEEKLLKNDNIICMRHHLVFGFHSEVRCTEPHSRYTDNLPGGNC